MAVETLILRPTYGYAGTGVYPSTLSVETAHLAVCEEVSDEDATYVVSPGGMSSSLMLGFSIPDDYTTRTPVSIRVIFRAKSTDTGSATQRIEAVGIGDTDGDGTPVLCGSAGITPLSDTYETYTSTLASEYILCIWEQMHYATTTGGSSVTKYHILLQGTALANDSNNNKVAMSSRVTQVYLEVDFEVEEDTPTPEIHIKRNGTWLGVTQQFRKVDGVWVEIDTAEANNVLTNNQVVMST